MCFGSVHFLRFSIERLFEIEPNYFFDHQFTICNLLSIIIFCEIRLIFTFFLDNLVFSFIKFNLPNAFKFLSIFLAQNFKSLNFEIDWNMRKFEFSKKLEGNKNLINKPERFKDFGDNENLMKTLWTLTIAYCVTNQIISVEYFSVLAWLMLA